MNGLKRTQVRLDIVENKRSKIGPEATTKHYLIDSLAWFCVTDDGFTWFSALN
jgi:hypothetical protein